MNMDLVDLHVPTSRRGPDLNSGPSGPGGKAPQGQASYRTCAKRTAAKLR